MVNNKCIVVTGASRGIGRNIALEAAKNGARIGINYRDSAHEAHTVKQEIETAGLLQPLLLPFDATQPNDIQKGVESCLRHFGRIDGWVNNAAVNLPGLLAALSDEEIREQIDSALLGPLFCCKAVLPCMLQNRSGSIVNIGSVVAERVFRGQAVYAAAKGGLAAFTRALAVEYGKKGIRANCIQPGPVDTDMFRMTKHLAGDELLKQIPMGKFCTPQEVAALAVFLLSDQSASLTGAVITIDGGYSL